MPWGHQSGPRDSQAEDRLRARDRQVGLLNKFGRGSAGQSRPFSPRKRAHRKYNLDLAFAHQRGEKGQSMVEMSVNGGDLHIEVLGWSRLLGLKRSLDIPLTAIKQVKRCFRVAPLPMG
jgi:hypothetical protein